MKRKQLQNIFRIIEKNDNEKISLRHEGTSSVLIVSLLFNFLEKHLHLTKSHLM